MAVTAITDDRRDLEDAQGALGPDAHPTGRLRLLICKVSGSGRLQLEWTGNFGNGWFDVPKFDVEMLT
jgi:hypothetical protein